MIDVISSINNYRVDDFSNYIIYFNRDGTAKLWNVGSQKVIDNLIKFNPETYINCCSVSAPKNINLGERNTPVCK